MFIYIEKSLRVKYSKALKQKMAMKYQGVECSGRAGGRSSTLPTRLSPLINSVEWAFVHCEALCLLCTDSMLIYPFTC